MTLIREVEEKRNVKEKEEGEGEEEKKGIVFFVFCFVLFCFFSRNFF